MAVNVLIRSNVKLVQKNFDRFFKKFPNLTKKGLAQASFQLQAIIKELTSKSQDFNRRRFPGYTDAYIERLKRESKPLAVDLFYTGRMLGSITGKVLSARKATVFFNNSEMRQRAFFNQTQMGSKNRKFFGIGDRTKDIIRKQFVRFMEKEIRKMRI
tara:strand:+ start:1654 stop:2124 length:471 start_codon:yes stop_codon:yes gene_type:complete